MRQPRHHETRRAQICLIRRAADSTIWKYLGPLCFHSWWSEKIPDSEFEKIAGLAKAWNKEVWCSELGFDCFTTTLTISPHKNSKVIFEIAKKVAGEYGVKFLEVDFKKQDGFKESVGMCKEMDVYRQN